MLKRFGIVISFLFILLCGAVISLWYLPLTNSTAVPIEIKSGQTLTQLAHQWEKDGWLPSALLLRIQARVYGEHLKVGEYVIPEGLDSSQLLPYLKTASPVFHRITLVEGQTLHQTLAALANEPRLEQDVQPLTVDNVSKVLGIDGSAEGWIYPDTYLFTKGYKVSELLKQSYQRMQDELEQSWNQRAANLPYKTPYEALIMASIVEKETAVESERPIIAGVFVRRLHKRMRLETDPTVIYGLGSTFEGNLRRKHLNDSSNLWNTYRNFGLPPTPIALAGKKAIEAALHPADGNELFFVAKGDGSHVFSATLEEHNKAVQEYQIRNRAKNYRSTPLPAGD